MLILERRPDEQIVIGHDIVLTIIEVRGGKVRLGIAADPSIPIHRKEVAEEIARGRPEHKHRTPGSIRGAKSI